MKKFKEDEINIVILAANTATVICALLYDCITPQ